MAKKCGLTREVNMIQGTSRYRLSKVITDYFSNNEIFDLILSDKHHGENILLFHDGATCGGCYRLFLKIEEAIINNSISKDDFIVVPKDIPARMGLVFRLKVNDYPMAVKVVDSQASKKYVGMELYNLLGLQCQ